MGRLGITILVYAALGPPLGLAVLAGWTMLVSRDASIPSVLDLLGSYLVGELPALVAGAVVSTTSMRLRDLTRIGMIIGLVVGVLLAGANVSNWETGLRGVLGVALVVGVLALTCLVPTIACGVVARRFLKPDRSQLSHLSM